MIRTLKTVWFILIAGLLLGLFVYSVHFESRARQSLTVLSTDAYQEIVTSKKKIAINKFAGKLLNSGTEAAVTNEDYLICAPLDADAAIKTVSFQGTSYQAAFAPDAAFDDFAKAVSENHPFQLIVWNKTKYFDQQVYFTSLPVMVFSYDTPFSRYSDDLVKTTAVACSLITADGNVTESAATIRVRGQLAASFPKIPYRLTLYRNRGTRNPQSLLGMTESSEWVMLSLYTDPARIRDKVSLDLWNDLAKTNPSVNGSTGEFEYCEVVVNEYYEGLYGIVRPVDAGTLQIDRDEQARYYQFMNDFKDEVLVFPKENPARLLVDLASVKYPKQFPANVDPHAALMKYADLFTGMQIQATPDELEALLDPANSIDYALFTACASANDNLFKNAYFVWRTGADGSYRFYRVPWDLDFTWGDYYSGTPPLSMQFSMSQTTDPRLTDDILCWLSEDTEGLGQAFISRWNELRAELFSESALQTRMLEQTTLLKQNGVYQRETDRWKDSPASADLSETYAFLLARLDYLDSYFTDLTQ